MTINSANNMRTKSAFDYLKLNEDKLSDSQKKFVKSLKIENKKHFLSDRQMQCLFEIEKSLRPNRILLIRSNY
jgi:hypothetical protein